MRGDRRRTHPQRDFVHKPFYAIRCAVVRARVPVPGIQTGAVRFQETGPGVSFTSQTIDKSGAAVVLGEEQRHVSEISGKPALATRAERDTQPTLPALSACSALPNQPLLRVWICTCTRFDQQPILQVEKQ